MENQYLIVLCSCPDEATAARLASALVDERLAACVNRLPALQSNFRWEGEVQEATEILLLAKTTGARLAALSARIRALHPYELPEVVAIPIAGGSQPYLDWIGDSVA